ncbi:MAG: glutamyl-tRNA reductase, partial [Propionibacteriales bacterium]|nr:glutamyl-tRNA reductase [Propionibacteriales bacterium]
MSFLVVGMSHKSAPIAVLEQTALDHDAVVKLLHQALESEHVSESVIVSTCNRVEVYVETDRFHGSVEEISALLADHGNLPREGFVSNAYVHYDEAAVAHLFAVTAGLDSMVVGESQILGQVRTALQAAQAEGTVGALLNTLFQQSLRIGKRGHAETGIDRLGASVVSEALDLAGVALIGADRRFLVAGAGSMAGLAVATLLRRDIRANQITVVNRTRERA